MAWEKVCQDKQDGGLRIKQLEVQNVCLLLKMLHRLHHPDGSAWAHWVGSQVNLADLSGDMAGVHWIALRDLLSA